MLLQPVDPFVYAWLAIAILAALYVAFDQFTGNPEATVMKWGFVLVTLYMGPFGLLLYVMADKEPAPGSHEAFVKPLWKQGIGSTVHCVAGDATGIILAAVVTTLIGLPMWVDLIVEYAAGFLFGLLIFQALFMRKVMGGTYLENVRRSFLPEFISMNAMMAGMAPVMSFLMMGRDMRAMWPTEPLFWAVMSFGICVGFAIAYPANLWLVAQELKHGLMTVRETVGAAKREAAPRVSKRGPKGAMTMGGAVAHEGHSMAAKSTRSLGDRSGPTRAKLVTVSGFTVFLLIAGVSIPAAFVNLGLRAEDVRGLIMPAGMITTPETSAAAMHDMAAADPRDVTFTAAPGDRGDRVLAPRLEDGVKVFDLEASVITWYILPDVPVTAFAINHQVPGPRLEVIEGDRVRINLTNRLPESTSMHWHGLMVPNAMDGPAHITQAPIPPGGRFVYEFVVRQTGTYLYHTHDNPDRQQALGLYGALIVRPRLPEVEPPSDAEYVVQLQEWLHRDGLTYPAMPMDGGFPNYFTINGKAFPATDTLHLRVGQSLKLRFIGSNGVGIHPMHMHGGPFTVIARDGQSLAPSAQFQADVVNIGPGQRYDVLWPARGPGKWLLHCHISHHTTNNNVEARGGGGLMLLVDVAP